MTKLFYVPETLSAVLCLLTTLSSCRGRSETSGRNHLRTYNVDPTFSRWPDRNNVLFYLDSDYSPTEQSYIRTAIARFQSQMKGCLTFVETTASDSRFKVHVTPYVSGVLQAFCYSYPGQSNNAVNTGATEQLLIITRGPNGCLDGSLRSIMKLFAILVGKRNEHQRGDRESYITVFENNIIVANSYRLYNSSEARWLLRPYDYCSITHNQPTDYSAPGTQAFAILSGPSAIPKIDQISNYDCQIISTIYNCAITACDAFDCLTARQNSLGTAPSSPATTAGPTTTLRPSSTPMVTSTTMKTTTVQLTTTPSPTSTSTPPATTTTVVPTTSTAAPPATTMVLPTTTTIGPTTTTLPPTTTTLAPPTSTLALTTTTVPPTTTTLPPTTTTPLPTTTTTQSPTTTTALPTTTTIPPTTTTVPPTTTTVPPTTTTMAPTTTTLPPTTTTLAPTTTTIPPTTTTVPPTTTTIPPTTTTLPPTTTTLAPTTTTIPPTTTTAIPSTTTANPCPLSAFCSTSPSESGYLGGPFAAYQTLLLYSGNCVLEYTFDFNTQLLIPQTSGQLITSYFPSPGGSSAPMPVTFAYTTVDPSLTYFTLHATNQALSTDLACPADTSLSTMAATCPSGATASTVSATYTSASSQLNIGDLNMYQYAVDASQKEVVLTSQDFSTVYQTSSGFLAGQSFISTITAIQVMQDQGFVNPTALAVFGLGSDGITPYVGYVTMPLQGEPTTPLTGIVWTTPQPLRQTLVGCP